MFDVLRWNNNIYDLCYTYIFIGKEKIMNHNPQYSDTEKTIAIDFDGVIHKNSKGFYDGTIYDEPVKNVKKSLRFLSKKYILVIYSTKCRPDRDFPDNNSGASNIREWLEEYDLWKYINRIEVYKPPAFLYIDDSGFRFENWDDTLKFIKGLK
jgi:hypothetical protein